MVDRQSSDAESSGGEAETASNRKCCMGVLYFSQSLHANSKGPVCAGIRTRMSMPHVDDVAQNEAVPAGGFKYFCVGMSLWDQERMRANSKKAVHPGDPVELPYCEGLEIISASHIQQAPVVLAADAGAVGASPQQPSSSSREPPQRPSRDKQQQFFPGGGRGFGDAVDWGAFPGRFTATAGKVLAKMHSNALLLADNMKRTVEELAGRGRGQ